MFELTNEQRKCFALHPVLDEWIRIEIKPSPYDIFKTYAYLENNVIVKCVIAGNNTYTEYEMREHISDDGKYLLPKTDRGKSVLLSSSNLLKRSKTGMCLSYNDKYICLYNSQTDCSYYSTSYDKQDISDIFEFAEWVKNWCNETTDQDIDDIENFAKQKRRHIKYKEGDVFCFKINRRLYGYGRILLDYDKMRKQNQPFWDILMSKPLVCSVYHIVTEKNDLTIDELKQLKSLPSTILADNNLYYGEYQIIGNMPINDHEDYPVLYGNSIMLGEKALCLQYGKTYKKIENAKALYNSFRNNSVSFSLNFTLRVLSECIDANSNEPYWNNYYEHWVNCDLRNPKFSTQLREIAKQMEITI